jgi:hypothetical protein
MTFFRSTASCADVFRHRTSIEVISVSLTSVSDCYAEAMKNVVSIRPFCLVPTARGEAAPPLPTMTRT